MKNTKIIQDISLLYELSLSVGDSLDMKQNCEQFLNILIARKNLNFGSIWIKDNDQYKIIYCTPKNIHDKKVIDSSHYILEKLQTRDKFVISSDHHNFKKCIHEKNINGGAFGIFKLDDVGFLKLNYPAASGRGISYSLNKLN